MSDTRPLLNGHSNGNGHKHSPMNGHSKNNSYGSIRSSPTSSIAAMYASQPKSNWLQSTSTTFKSIVGSGICALPFAFFATGWLSGTIGLIIIAFASTATMHQMITCVHVVRERMIVQGILEKDNQSPLGYRQIGSYLFGSTGKLIVDIALITSQLGGNCAFIAFILSCIHSTLETLQYHVSYTMIVAVLFPILILLAIPRSTTHLAPVSHIGNIALAVGVGTVFYYGLTHTTLSFTTMSAFNHGLFGISTFFGIAAYSLCAHAEVMAVEYDSDNTSRYRNILNCTMFTITTLYIIFAIFAYACFGINTQSNIFLNLGDGTFVMIMKISMAVVVMFNYPISLIPATKTIEEWIFPTPVSLSHPSSVRISPTSTYTQSSRVTPVLPSTNGHTHVYVDMIPHENGDVDEDDTNSSSYYYWLGNVLRVILVAITCIVALLLNDFGLLAALVGSLTGGLLSFVMPPIFYAALLRHELSRAEILLVISQLIFGGALMATGIVVVFQV